MTTDEERWTQAEEILRNGPGPDARRRIRQRKILFWSLLGGSLLLGLVVAFVVALLAGGHRQHHTEVPLWQAIAVIAFSAAGVVIEAIALFVMWRSGQLRNRWYTPMSALSRPQRRELTRQVLGKAPADRARLPLARDLAERTTLTTRYLLLVFAGMVLILTSQLLSRPTGWALWLLLPAVATWFVAVPLAIRQGRKVRRFLDEHPADDGPGG